MKYHYWIIGLSIVLTLNGCGSNSATKDVIVAPFVVKIDETYIKSSGSGDGVYRKGTGDEDATLIQFALTRVDTGVNLDQMTQLNLQKLSVSIPGYQYISSIPMNIGCNTIVYSGLQVNFITNQGEEKLYHSQYYTITQSQGRIRSAVSTVNTASSSLTDIVSSVRCVSDTIQ